jgi:hypothetical protein
MINMNKKVKEVTTIDGKIVDRNDAVRFLIDGKYVYYQKNVTCFKIQNLDGVIKNDKDWQWHRIDNGLISYDADENKWDLISRLNHKYNCVKGIYDETKNIGYFTANIHKTVYLKDDFKTSKYIACINAELAEKLGYFDLNYDGFYYLKSALSVDELKYITNNKPQKAEYKFDGVLKSSVNKYGADDTNVAFIKILKHYSSNNINILHEDFILSNFIKEFTFGAEFETNTGFIPEKYCYKYGVIPLRDGSIGGYEYTTIPLFGNKGVATLRNLCNILTKRTTIDYNCSFHLHLGGYDRTSESIVALYKLILQIQDEIFLMFPAYQQNKPKYLGTSKNYCKKLPELGFTGNIKDDLNEIFMFLTAPEDDNHCIDWERSKSIDSKWNLNTYVHPLDTSGQSKWNIKSRYYHINLVPFVFSKKHTVEFRLHTPTTNFTKVINWLLICSAILKFAKINQTELLENKLFTLTDVLNVYKNKNTPEGINMSEYLVKYHHDRKSYFMQCLKNNDIYGTELTQDKTYKFESKTKIDEYIRI